MPVPVPPGRFAEYVAAICEGFCPACAVPLEPWPLMSYGPRGDCKACGNHWFYEKRSGQINWRGQVGEAWWDVWELPR
jgi:hypothetical protein